MAWLQQVRGDRYTTHNITVKALVENAYGVMDQPLADSQIIGAPHWFDADHFDIEAKAPAPIENARGTLSEDVLSMFRSLLESRFGLVAHVEQRDLPIFALELARHDGTLGPNLHKRTIPCVSASAAARDAASDPSAKPEERAVCGGMVARGSLQAKGLTMIDLASGLANMTPGVNRVVVDRTGLAGTFDVDLAWTPVNMRTDTSGVSLFTAMEEQLGLKLESGTGPVDVLVIDHVEKPTPD
jgi:uncharacterized protein (TIGR03435 family)